MKVRSHNDEETISPVKSKRSVRFALSDDSPVSDPEPQLTRYILRGIFLFRHSAIVYCKKKSEQFFQEEKTYRYVEFFMRKASVGSRKRILIVGSSKGVGLALTCHYLGKPEEYEVHITTTRPENAKANLQDLGLEVSHK